MNLTPPPELVSYRKGADAGAGGIVGTTGGAGATGVGLGGSLGIGGAVAGAGGVTGAGGITVPPDARGVGGGAGSANPDVALGSGGATGGSVAHDDAAELGTGGKKLDSLPDTGGSTADAPVGTGGGVGSGGVVGTGGKGDTGGTTAGTGGLIGTGGAVGTGGLVGTGGVIGSGGAVGTGGSSGYNCASALVPASGYVTNFKDWNATTARWGTGTLIGTIFNYASTSPVATMTAKVEGTTPGLHLVGSVSSTGYAGGGLTFLSCVTAETFTKISFDVYGSAGSCAIELQLQTFDQRPNTADPPGSCNPSGTCYTFPRKSQVVSLSTAVAAPGTTVSTTLSSLTNWSAAEGAQIVGVQWQFTGTCSIDATFTNIKFVP